MNGVFFINLLRFDFTYFAPQVSPLAYLTARATSVRGIPTFVTSLFTDYVVATNHRALGAITCATRQQ